MSAATLAEAPPARPVDGLLSYDDLELRWNVTGPTAEARNKEVRRICLRIGLKPLQGFGRGSRARFRPATVHGCEVKMDPAERRRRA